MVTLRRVDIHGYTGRGCHHPRASTWGSRVHPDRRDPEFLHDFLAFTIWPASDRSGVVHARRINGPVQGRLKMTALLSIRNLYKSFGGVVATKDLSLDVTANELHAIIGPNGAGKTTLISQLSGAQKPDAGSIWFDGKDITVQAAHKRADMGIARSFQITNLISDMTVLENVSLAAQAKMGHSFKFLKPAKTVESIRSPAFEAMNAVGIADRADRIVHTLSHGEHRLIEIAIALVSDARLMLLDEPMAGLGREETAEMVELLNSIKGKQTILLIEHDMDAVFALADRISVLVYGHIIATGTPNEIRSNEKVRRAYLGEEAA